MTDQTNPTDPVINELDELQAPQVVQAPVAETTPVVAEPAKEEKSTWTAETNPEWNVAVAPPEPVVAKPEKTEEKKEEKTEKKTEEKPKPKKKAEPKVEKVKKDKVEKVKTEEKNETLEKYKQMVMFIQNTVNSMEMDIKRVKLVLGKLAKFDLKDITTLEAGTDADSAMWMDSLQNTYTEEDSEVVEGLFDGYFMVGKDQKKYPVPLNYSSKTKLVPGDVLKLKIMGDGKFIYKLIKPVDRKHMRALLSKTDENKFVAVTDEWKTFFLNQAAVTFYKGKPGDELYVVINQDESGGFAAIEAIIKK